MAKKKNSTKRPAWSNLMISADTHALIEKLARKLKTEALDGTEPSKHGTIRTALLEALKNRS